MPAKRALLRTWQEKVLAAVQSTQLDSAAVLPLFLSSRLFDFMPVLVDMHVDTEVHLPYMSL